MGDSIRSLTGDDVRQIADVVQVLEQSGFDFLQLELGDLKLTISKGAAPLQSTAVMSDSAVLAAASASLPAATAASAGQDAQCPPAPAPGVALTLAEDVVAVVAPIVGKFYAQPEPGSPPFVTLGAQIEPETTVALIEVMKLFNAVAAGVRGEVVEICVTNGQFVEHGQVLFHVRTR